MNWCHLPISSSCFDVVAFQQLSKDILYVAVQLKQWCGVNTQIDFRCCLQNKAVQREDLWAELGMKCSGD